MRSFIMLVLIALTLPSVIFARGDFVVEAIKQSMQGTQITRIALRPIPNSTSMQMTLFTKDGERTLILSHGHVATALTALNNAQVVGKQNVSISRQLIAASPHLKKYLTPHDTLKPAVVIANSTILATNQQASR